jgi:hypothetical protein
MVSHRTKPLELYHIDIDGIPSKVSDYKAIGSGTKIADRFCGKLEFDKILMKEFIKCAYLAIMYMNQYCPGLEVGVEQNGVPDITYLFNNQEWDKRPAQDFPQDIEDCKSYANPKLGQIGQAFESIVKK